MSAALYYRREYAEPGEYIQPVALMAVEQHEQIINELQEKIESLKATINALESVIVDPEPVAEINRWFVDQWYAQSLSDAGHHVSAFLLDKNIDLPKGTKLYALRQREPNVPNKRVSVFQSKGTGQWHVCQLQERVWRSVNDMWFKTRSVAVVWASKNGYEVLE